jgi:hypothetical protein
MKKRATHVAPFDDPNDESDRLFLPHTPPQHCNKRQPEPSIATVIPPFYVALTGVLKFLIA